MDINLYSQDSIDKRMILDFGKYVFDDSDITENAEYTRSVNPSGDFAIGTSSCAQFKFELNNLYRTVPDIAGMEFTLKRGIQTQSESIFDIYRRIRANLIVLDGKCTYAANQKGLTVYNSEGIPSYPEQPLFPIQSLFMVDGVLYCGHDKEPYLTAYSALDGKLTQIAAPVLDLFQTDKITRLAGKAFRMQGNFLNEYSSVFHDLKVTDFIQTTFEFSQQGIFVAEKPEKLNDNKITVVSYDRMTRFEINVDDVIDSLTYPVSLLDFIRALCAKAGVTFATSDFTNSGFMIPENYKVQNTTGRQMLQYAAQVAASFAHMNELGELCLSWYSSKQFSLNEKQLTSISVSEYQTDVIDKVQVRYSEPDIGVIVPIDEAKTNAYIIENNPLLYTKTDALIRPCVENIYNQLKLFSYIPFTADCIQGNPFIGAGDVMQLKSRKGDMFSGFIMESTLKGVKALSASYKCTGDKVRKVQSDAVNQAIQRINGRTNEIITTVDEFSVTLTEVKDETQVNTAELLIQADQISSKVSQTDYNGNTISSLINQTATEILIQAEKINLSGYATFSSLSESGTTVINGDNITAGTINGDIINGGTINGANMIWGGGQVEMGAVDETSSGTLYAYIKAKHQLMVDTNIIRMNAVSVFLGNDDAGATYFNSPQNNFYGTSRFSGTTYFDGSLNVSYGEFDNLQIGTKITTGNAAIGYLVLAGDGIYKASDGTLRWK